jgi:hypothetical protein
VGIHCGIYRSFYSISNILYYNQISNVKDEKKILKVFREKKEKTKQREYISD